MIGLRLDRSEIGFLNNLIYSLCLSNNLESVPKYLDRITQFSIQNFTDTQKIMFQATIGLYYIRNKNMDEGKKLYKLAMENSKIINSEFYYNLALINFTRELYIANDHEFKYYFELFNKIKSDDQDIQLQMQNVLQIILVNK